MDTKQLVAIAVAVAILILCLYGPGQAVVALLVRTLAGLYGAVKPTRSSFRRLRFRAALVFERMGEARRPVIAGVSLLAFFAIFLYIERPGAAKAPSEPSPVWRYIAITALIAAIMYVAMKCWKVIATWRTPSNAPAASAGMTTVGASVTTTTSNGGGMSAKSKFVMFIAIFAILVAIASLVGWVLGSLSAPPPPTTPVVQTPGQPGTTHIPGGYLIAAAVILFFFSWLRKRGRRRRAERALQAAQPGTVPAPEKKSAFSKIEWASHTTRVGVATFFFLVLNFIIGCIIGFDTLGAIIARYWGLWLAILVSIWVLALLDKIKDTPKSYKTIIRWLLASAAMMIVVYSIWDWYLGPRVIVAQPQTQAWWSRVLGTNWINYGLGSALDLVLKPMGGRKPVKPVVISNAPIPLPMKDKEWVVALLAKYFPEEEMPTALAVCFCESGYRQLDENGQPLHGPMNSNGSYDYGLMAINEFTHKEMDPLGSYDVKRDAEDNVKFARILHQKRGWGPWESSAWCWRERQKPDVRIARSTAPASAPEPKASDMPRVDVGSNDRTTTWYAGATEPSRPYSRRHDQCIALVQNKRFVAFPDGDAAKAVRIEPVGGIKVLPPTFNGISFQSKTGKHEYIDIVFKNVKDGGCEI